MQNSKPSIKRRFLREEDFEIEDENNIENGESEEAGESEESYQNLNQDDDD